MHHTLRAPLRHITALLAASLLAIPAAQAQVRAASSKPPAFPPGLQWKQMELVTIDPSAKKPKTADKPALRSDAKMIWQETYDAYLAARPNSLVEVLVAEARGPNYRVVASLLNLPLDFERCEPPANGFNVTDMYSKCLGALGVDGKYPVIVRFDGYCFLHIDNDTNNPLSKNHTEFAFDHSTATGYFRTIQHGKPVPACNHSIQFRG